MYDLQCDVCGSGFFLPSGCCDHCDSVFVVQEKIDGVKKEMPKLNREHVSVACLLRFLKAKHARIKKSGKPHSATTVSCFVGSIEDAMDEFGEQGQEYEANDLESLLAASSFHLKGVVH